MSHQTNSEKKLGFVYQFFQQKVLLSKDTVIFKNTVKISHLSGGFNNQTIPTIEEKKNQLPYSKAKFLNKFLNQQMENGEHQFAAIPSNSIMCFYQPGSPSLACTTKIYGGVRLHHPFPGNAAEYGGGR